MTDTIGVVDLNDDQRQALAQRLVDQARAGGEDLVGPEGLLTGLTKQVLETALEEELTENLGYEHSDRAGKPVTGDGGGNERNGTRSKTVLTQVGPVTIDVPRDREGPLIRRSCASGSVARTGWASWSCPCPRGD